MLKGRFLWMAMISHSMGIWVAPNGCACVSYVELHFICPWNLLESHSKALWPMCFLFLTCDNYVVLICIVHEWLWLIIHVYAKYIIYQSSLSVNMWNLNSCANTIFLHPLVFPGAPKEQIDTHTHTSIPFSQVRGPFESISSPRRSSALPTAARRIRPDAPPTGGLVRCKPGGWKKRDGIVQWFQRYIYQSRGMSG